MFKDVLVKVVPDLLSKRRTFFEALEAKLGPSDSCLKMVPVWSKAPQLTSTCPLAKDQGHITTKDKFQQQ